MGNTKKSHEEQEQFHCPNCCTNAHASKPKNWDKIKDNLSKVIIPLFLPLTLLFYTHKQNKIAEAKKNNDIIAANKKAAIDKEIAKQGNQLDMEIKVLAIIWPDLTSENEEKKRDALDLSYAFLKKIYSDKTDTLSPLLTSVSVIAKNILATSNNTTTIAKAKTFEMEYDKPAVNQKIQTSVLESKDINNTYSSNKITPISEQKKQISTSLKNQKLLSIPKVFIQYSNNENKKLVEDLALKLSNFYIIPPIDYVENKIGYTNEIRFYSDNEKELAKQVQTKLYEITGLTFQLKNINHETNVRNTIEVWYNNITQINGQLTEVGNDSYYEICNYKNLWFKPNYFLNFKEYDLSIQLLELKQNEKSATIKINSYNNSYSEITTTLTPTKARYEFSNNEYKYVIILNNVAKAGKNFFIPNAAYVDVLIFKKK